MTTNHLPHGRFITPKTGTPGNLTPVTPETGTPGNHSPNLTPETGTPGSYVTPET